MIIPSHTIEQLCADQGSDDCLICPFDKENLRASSYDLTVGEEYYIGGEADSTTLATKRLKARQAFTIPPHAVCFVLAAETISLPDDLTARVSLRMSYIYSGMILSSQPPFDPHYRGRVIVMLHNLSSTPFHMKAGERLATIEFTRVAERTAGDKRQGSVKSIEQQLPRPIVSSLAELAKAATAASERVTWLSAQMMVFAALIVAVLAVPNFYSYSMLQDRLSEQKEKLQEATKDIAALQSQAASMAQSISAQASSNERKKTRDKPERSQ